MLYTLPYQKAKTTQKEMKTPMKRLKVVKKGTMRGSAESQSRTFQSQVGKGLTPRPLVKPVIVLTSR